MDLATSKNLGGVGVLLMLIGPFLGAISSALSLIGLILVLIALNSMSDHYNERGIFNNALYGAIAMIIGIATSVTVIVVAAVDFLTAVGIDLNAVWTDPTILSSIDWEALVTWDILWTHIAAILGGLVLLFIFIVIAAIFVRRSLSILSAKTGVKMFGTAGLIILIGAILTIIAVGLILLWIALILLTIAFFSIKITPAEPPQAPPS